MVSSFDLVDLLKKSLVLNNMYTESSIILIKKPFLTTVIFKSQHDVRSQSRIKIRRSFANGKYKSFYMIIDGVIL